MASCFYYFSNGKELLRLVEEKKFDELKETFEKTQLCSSTKVNDEEYFALPLYATMMDALKKDGELHYCDFVKIAAKLFAEAWLVTPLLEMRESKARCGWLGAEVRKVLSEYDEYKKATLEARERNLSVITWEEKYNDFVTLRGNKGRVSFFRYGVEYVIYYGEDKYYTEATSNH